MSGVKWSVPVVLSFGGVRNLDCESTNYPRLVWEVPVGDLTCPHGVDSFDFAFFGNRWMNVNCGDDDCEGADLDSSGAVDWRDVEILFDRWLDGAAF